MSHDKQEIKMRIVNLTPHLVRLNSGEEYPASGKVARVSCSYSEQDGRGVCRAIFGEVSDLPAPVDGVLYIVSGMVASAVPGRDDVVAPATGHPDAIRNEKGHIVSVPCWVK